MVGALVAMLVITFLLLLFVGVIANAVFRW
jgi:hypothetical protein